MTLTLLPITRGLPKITVETHALFLLMHEPEALGIATGKRVLAQLKASDNAAIADQARQIEAQARG